MLITALTASSATAARLALSPATTRDVAMATLTRRPEKNVKSMVIASLGKLATLRVTAFELGESSRMPWSQDRKRRLNFVELLEFLHEMRVGAGRDSRRTPNRTDEQ